MLRKVWDHKLRVLFSEKHKFQKFYEYNQDYLNGLNGYTLHIKNNKKIFINDKINSLIDSKIKSQLNEESNPFGNAELNKNIDTKLFLNSDLNIKQNQIHSLNGRRSSPEIDNYQRSEDEVVIFLKNLIFVEKYEDINRFNTDLQSGTLNDEFTKRYDFLISNFNKSI